MKLVRNRWLFEDNDKTWFKFGKYNGEALEDVVSTRDGRWYVENVMFKFEDLPHDVRAFLEKALEIDGDPLGLPHNHVSEPKAAATPPAFSRFELRMAALKQQAKLKRDRANRQQHALRARREEEETKQALEKRKEEAEW